MTNRAARRASWASASAGLALLVASLSGVALARGQGEDLLAGFDPLRHEAREGVRVAALRGGRRAVLTLDDGLQRHLEGELERFDVPQGAVVAADPASGRVLAYVSHSSAAPRGTDLVRDASAPAASVFKIVTGAALLDAGVGPGARVCYGGGASGIAAADLVEDPARDTQCASLAEAMGRSINAVFARLADRHLDAPTMRRYGAAFAFGQTLPFDVASAPSRIEISDERLEFARTAAGFWHVHMSPLHGMLLAATIANGGVMPRASMIDRVEDAGGRVLSRHRPQAFRSVIPRGTARRLARMMELTVSRGTARSAFHDPAGQPFLPGIAVAGKTGTLSAERPYRGYTWWVGFAPAENPTIAVAALVVNTPRWRIKASYLAREALRYYLVERPQELAAGG